MLIVPRLMLLASIALFLAAMAYVGYVNEHLKVAVADIHRGTILIGFIVGAGAASRYLGLVAMKAYRRAARERRR